MSYLKDQNQYPEYFAWGFAADAHHRLLLAADPASDYVDLRYWSLTINNKIYRTNRGIHIPKSCLAELAIDLEDAQRFAYSDPNQKDIARSTILGPKPNSIQNVGEQTNVALWTWVPPAIKNDPRPVHIELWEVDEEDVGYWALNTFEIPPHQVAGLLQTLRSIATGQQNNGKDLSEPDNRT